MGYVSAYTLATGNAYTDRTLDECTVAKGRQNEPSVGVDPRNTSVLLGSSNDYCGVYNQGAAAGAVGPIWLGYYRSENGGTSWKSSLVPGYPDDTSPYAALSQARTAGAGDPVIAWDGHGRAFSALRARTTPPARRRRSVTSGWLGSRIRAARVRPTPQGRPAATTARPSSQGARRLRTCWASSTTRRQSRPIAPVAPATATSTSRGRGSPATAATRSTSPARPTTVRRSRARSS